MREEARRCEEEERQRAEQRERERREKAELERAMRDEAERLEREKRDRAGVRTTGSGVRGVRGTRASMRAGAAAARGVSRAGAPFPPRFLFVFVRSRSEGLFRCRSIGLVDWCRRSYKGTERVHGTLENCQTVIGCVLGTGHDWHPKGHVETTLTGAQAVIYPFTFVCIIQYVCIISAHLYRWLDLHWTIWTSRATNNGGGPLRRQNVPSNVPVS